MKKILAGGLLVIAFTTSALAGQYWVVLDSNTNRCAVVTARPNDPTTRLVGALPYATSWEAENAMRTAAVCVAE
jgi:hypothetical protein